MTNLSILAFIWVGLFLLSLLGWIIVDLADTRKRDPAIPTHNADGTALTPDQFGAYSLRLLFKKTCLTATALLAVGLLLWPYL